MTVPPAHETAWQIHQALSDWTGKVDSKASFALAIESAVLAGVISLTESERPLGQLRGWLEHSLFWCGMAALFLAVLTSVWVVRPRLRKKKAEREAPDNFIYFGHLKQWDAAALAAKLEVTDPTLSMSRQLVTMSKIAWEKHVAVQWSMQLAAVGAGLLVVTYVLAG